MKSFHFSDNTPTKQNDRYWTFCVGSGHASLALRADYQEQLKRAHDELGFQRVRFHGIFNDDMKVITRFSDYISLIPYGKKVKTQSFYHIALVFDALLKIGIKPFVELSFMPSALASGKRTVFYYKGNITTPKNYDAWEAFIKDFIRFLIGRYGRSEVESWYFEVWNEPDLRFFFFSGRQEDYFRLYASTVKAIRQIDKNIIVGGPATSNNKWIKETRAFCEKERVQLSFLSTHHYPGDDLGLPIFSKENLSKMAFSAKRNQGATVTEVINKMLYRPEKLPLIRRDSLQKQAVKAKEDAGDVPLIYTEWNVNPTCTAPVHDTAQSAAYIVKHVMDCQYIMDGCSFWTFSDIFEELTFLPQPFSGSFGLMNIYGIPKPSYWAFYMLNLLEGERFDLPTTHEDIELAAFRGKDKIQLLLYRQNYCEGSPDREQLTVTLDTTQKIESAYVMSIDRDHCNPKRLWEEMGKPDYLSQIQVEEIMEKTKLSAEKLAFSQGENQVAVHTALADNDIQLIQLLFS